MDDKQLYHITAISTCTVSFVSFGQISLSRLCRPRSDYYQKSCQAGSTVLAFYFLPSFRVRTMGDLKFKNFKAKIQISQLVRKLAFRYIYSIISLLSKSVILSL